MNFRDANIFFEDPLLLEILEYGFPRKINTRKNHFEEMDDWNFYKRFRLRKQTVYSILELIEDQLEFETDINCSVSPINQLLACLRFYATNGHLMSVADFSGMHTSTVSRIVKKVSEAIATLAGRFIKMPETPTDILVRKNDFFAISNFPKVIGAVDGTHIRIQSPGGDDNEIYRNRKGYYSLNVQAICDANLKILDIVARWPGSAHDSTIFRNSRVRGRFDAGEFPDSILLGDSGYALRPYLFTPVQDPNTRAKRLYNDSHIRTRNCVERLFGVWKRRFPVLAYGLRLNLDTALSVIVATAVLHNICVESGEPASPLPENIPPDQFERLLEDARIPPLRLINNDRLNARDEFINNYFANLQAV